MAKGFTVSIDFDKIGRSIIKKGQAAQIKVYRQALTDSNRLCRVDTGRLRASSYLAGKPTDGRMTWRAPYAGRVYTSGVPSVRVNPSASLMWAHRAAAANRTRWLAVVKAAMKGNVK